MAVASMVAGWLHQREQSRRSNILMQLSSEFSQAISQKEIAQRMFVALHSALERCECHVRLLDQVAAPGGATHEVLRC